MLRLGLSGSAGVEGVAKGRRKIQSLGCQDSSKRSWGQCAPRWEASVQLAQLSGTCKSACKSQQARYPPGVSKCSVTRQEKSAKIRGGH